MRPALKYLLFTLVVPGSVAGYVPWLLTRGAARPTGFALALGASLLTIGGAIYAWCLWDFAAFGWGTPAPIDPPRRLVVRGLYRRTRNPMYVGVLTAILGWAAAYRSSILVSYALLAAACFHGFVVFYEEPTLRRAFGADYDAYCARVPRWLDPERRLRERPRGV
jgi:protein-S-isoprenylcysteine O-methyltransferase Ste14